MEDLLLSVVKDRRWEDLDCYARTASFACNARKVMLVDRGIDPETFVTLRALDFEVEPVDTTTVRLHFQSARYFAAADYLAKHRGEFRNVLWTDACDVVFQRDPFHTLKEVLGSALLVAVKEGWAIKNQAINDVWIQRLGLSPYEYGWLREQEVLCSGTIGGTAEAMEQLFTAMCEQMRDDMQGADQGLFNHLIRKIPFSTYTTIPEPEAGFVTTLGLFLAPSDEAVWTIKPPYLDTVNGYAYTKPPWEGGKGFAIQHQYNRAYGPLDPEGIWRHAVERSIR